MLSVLHIKMTQRGQSTFIRFAFVVILRTSLAFVFDYLKTRTQ